MRRHFIADYQPGSCEHDGCGKVVLRRVHVCRETKLVNDWPTSVPELYCGPDHCPECRKKAKVSAKEE